MVSLRSGRQDRLLVVVVWLLTVVVLGLGIATVNPILLVWGVLGLPAAVFLSYVHLRDTRPPAGPGGSGGPGGAETTSAEPGSADDSSS
ncbi:hypothetical protein FF36_03666 [Frankia torreyi]|uniref:DUF3099 family protein n=1 Tax=Frankia torreyi TaxID=1856 RepID=A0A0D8BDM5_9ACTN|nr:MULTISPECIES: hypothetical protein [Frankia]KJE22074.1 hypothetical protein FF36_03666 [Frankia torreyi]KQC36136.1 hypothetical protein UK82_22850 [Frankia sp. ACN1ag]KQM02570.1 hypothetical protein FF86_106213 [Frankia sp. CpI1-P]